MKKLILILLISLCVSADSTCVSNAKNLHKVKSVMFIAGGSLLMYAAMNNDMHEYGGQTPYACIGFGFVVVGFMERVVAKK